MSYRPSLDGLRALAMYVIVLFHTKTPWAEGAFIAKRMRDIGAEVGVDEEELGEVSKLLMRSKLIRIKR
ncbi:MAG: hypothetical protein ACLGH4_09320, partial [Actinomycetes bacterium]